MEERRETTENQSDLEGDVRTALQVGKSKLPANEFVKVEKNLASLGFFTPSSKRTRNERSKTVAVTVVIDGKRIEAKATIAPTALFGLPITADQDKWLALHKLISDIQLRDGKVTNPVAFSSAELLALLKIYKDSGKNYKDVSEWLDVMVGTTIISEGAVYFSGKRSFGKDTFHVFDRAVSFGKELPDGSIADRNYVWLSQWQLQNINDHHQLPIDLETYRQLKNHIAKALVPLLQIWLYATRDDGVFEKRYDELCQTLNIRRWPYLSKIKEKLGPSLDELKHFGYLADWAVESTSDKQGYKILLFHGEKFHRDRRARLSKKQTSQGSLEPRATATEPRIAVTHEPDQNSSAIHSEVVPAPSRQQFDPVLVSEITQRGITEKKALELLANLKPGQDKNLIAQLEHAELVVQQLHGTPNQVRNPAGFIVSLIERNTPLPDGFETRAQRAAREDRERKERARRAAQEAQQELEWEYDDYRDTEIDRYIAANSAAFEALKDAKSKEDRERFSFTTESMAKISARNEIQKQIPFLTFEEFVERKRQGTDLFLKPVGLSPAPEARTLDQGTKNTVPENSPAIIASDAANAAEAEMVTDSERPVSETSQASAMETTEPEVKPLVPEPLMIEPVSDPPTEENGYTSEAEAA